MGEVVYQDQAAIIASLHGVGRIVAKPSSGGNAPHYEVTVQHGERLKRDLLAPLLFNAQFNPQPELRRSCQQLIRAIANYMGVVPASLHGIYQARRRTVYQSKTIPLFNLSSLQYQQARAVFRAMRSND